MAKKQYKEYFEQNNFKGNNYETAKFIKFLMEKKTRGKDIEELTGIKHSQITSYKKIINSGKIEDLKNMSMNKVFKSIETNLNKKTQAAISKFDNEIPDKFMLGELYDSDDELIDTDDEEILAIEEMIKMETLKASNNLTDKFDYFIAELVDENKVLRRRIRQHEETRTKDKETIEELRKENASLQAYKKFFEEMKEKMNSIPN